MMSAFATDRLIRGDMNRIEQLNNNAKEASGCLGSFKNWNQLIVKREHLHGECAYGSMGGPQFRTVALLNPEENPLEEQGKDGQGRRRSIAELLQGASEPVAGVRSLSAASDSEQAVYSILSP